MHKMYKHQTIKEGWSNVWQITGSKQYVSTREHMWPPCDHLAAQSKLTTYAIFQYWKYCHLDLFACVFSFLFNYEASIHSKFCLFPWSKKFHNCLHAFLRLPPFNQNLSIKIWVHWNFLSNFSWEPTLHSSLFALCSCSLVQPLNSRLPSLKSKYQIRNL